MFILAVRMHTAQEIVNSQKSHQDGRKGDDRCDIESPEGVTALNQMEVGDDGIDNHCN